MSAYTRKASVIFARNGNAALKSMAEDDESVLNSVVNVDLLHRCPIHIRVLFNRANQFRDSTGALFDLVNQLLHHNRRSDTSQCVGKSLVAYPFCKSLQRL